MRKDKNIKGSDPSCPSVPFLFCGSVCEQGREIPVPINSHGHTNVGSGNENNASEVFDARDFGGFLTKGDNRFLQLVGVKCVFYENHFMFRMITRFDEEISCFSQSHGC